MEYTDIELKNANIEVARISDKNGDAVERITEQQQ